MGRGGVGRGGGVVGVVFGRCYDGEECSNTDSSYVEGWHVVVVDDCSS